MASAPKNNLPSDSQPWARYVEDRISDLKKVAVVVESDSTSALRAAASNAAQAADQKNRLTDTITHVNEQDITIESIGATADGKNTITRSTDPAPAGVTPGTDGDLWQQFSGTQIIAQWVHDGDEYQTVQLSHEVIASIDLGTATVGALTGAVIQTAASGARIELTADHFRKYDASENIEVDMPVGGDAAFSGVITASTLVGNEIMTATSGPRVYMKSGTEPVLTEVIGVEGAQNVDGAIILLDSGFNEGENSGSIIVSSGLYAIPASTDTMRYVVTSMTPAVPYEVTTAPAVGSREWSGISMSSSVILDENETEVIKGHPSISINGEGIYLQSQGQMVITANSVLGLRTDAYYEFNRPAFRMFVADEGPFKMLPTYYTTSESQRTTLLTAYETAGLPVGTTIPLFAWCDDVFDGTELRYSRDGTTWEAFGGSGGVTAHAGLTGLANDDHTQYHTDARGDARYYTKVQSDTALASKITGFSDPGADRIVFWDDSLSTWSALAPGTGLSLTGSTLSVLTASSTQAGVVELATDAEAVAGTDTSRAITPAGLRADATSKPIVSVGMSEARNYASSTNVQVMTWDAEDFDTHAMHSPSLYPSRLTCVKSGYYNVTGKCTTTGTSVGWTILALNKNGVEQPKIKVGYGPATGSYTRPLIAGLIYLSAGDYVELTLNSSAASGSPILIAESFFAAEFIRP